MATAAAADAVWGRWVQLAETMARVAEGAGGALGDVPAAFWQSVRVREDGSGPSPEQRAATVAAVVSYFTDVPAHVAAVNGLDHQQFVNPIVVDGGASRLSLGDLLEAYGRLGPGPYSRVWLAVVDLAAACNPVAVAAGPARGYLQQQIAAAGAGAGGAGGMVVAAAPHAAAAASTAPPPLDAILQSVLGAVPGLQECVASLVQSVSAESGPTDADVGAFVDRVIQPMMATLAPPPSADGASADGAPPPDLRPAINKIMEGLRGLTSVLAAGGGPDAPPAPLGGGGGDAPM